MTTTVIHNTTIATADAEATIHYDAAIAVDGSRIAAVGPSDAILSRFPNAERIDGIGKAVLPGFANCHTHFIRVFSRGIFEDLPAPKKAPYTRDRLGFPKMTLEEKRAMAQLACLEAIRSGTTLVMDISANIEEYAEAAAASGLRLVLGEQAADRKNGSVGQPGKFEADPAAAERSVTRIRALHQKWNGAADGRVTVAVAAHAPDMCSPALLKSLRGLQEDLDTVGTIHLNQYWGEVDMIRENYGILPTEYLKREGYLNDRLIASHCRCMTDGEMDILGAAGVAASFNPTIGARGGYMPDFGYLKEAGCPIVMGTDERSEDMVEVLRTGMFTERMQSGRGETFPPNDILRFATGNGYKALGVADGGVLKEGNKADLIVIDMRQPHLVPALRVVSNFVHHGQGRDIEASMVDGRWIMRDRKVLTLDEAALVRQVEEMGHRLWMPELAKAGKGPADLNPNPPRF
jgi:5-methylthioadenosine/S-adenosylhomocysteine deaminase